MNEARSFFQKIGKKIREIREEKKLTQFELADMAEIGQDQISKIEHGKEVKLSTIFKILQVFEIPFELFDTEENKKNQNLLKEILKEIIGNLAYNVMSYDQAVSILNKISKL